MTPPKPAPFTPQRLSILLNSDIHAGNNSFTIPASSGVRLPYGGLSHNDPRLKVGVTIADGTTTIQDLSSSPRVDPAPPVVAEISRFETVSTDAPDGVSSIAIAASTFDSDVTITVGIAALDTAQTPIDHSDYQPVGEVLTFSISGGAKPTRDVGISIGVPAAVTSSLRLRRSGMLLGQFWFDSTTFSWTLLPSSQVGSLDAPIDAAQ